MSKVAQSVLTDFGRAVLRARSLKGWQLKDLANAMDGNSGISFLSDIEKGKRSISAPTVGRLIKALSLDETWIDKFLRSDTTPEAEQTQQDRTADETLAHLPQIGADEKLAQAGVTETAVISLAQRIATETNDVAQAWNELQNAVEIALRVQTEGQMTSNHGNFVDTVLAQVADLAKDGDYDTASATIDDAVDQADAQLTRLLKHGVEVALLNRDTTKAATLLIRKTDLDAGGMATFETLRTLRRHYYETGRDKGSNLDSAFAIDLAEQVLNRATTADEHSTAQNDLGTALSILGERESRTIHLELAVTAFEEALKERTQARAPLDWAMTQTNLGNALSTLGARESGTKRLEQAVVAYEKALKVYPQTHMPLQWAATQNNLGNTLKALGERESGTKRLEQAVAAYEEALKVNTRARVPDQWAATQNNLGNTLTNLGDRESSTTRLQQAIAAYEEALKEYTQVRVPLDWAMTQNNLGTALKALGTLEGNKKRLEQAVTAFENALKERTQARVPLQWATTQNNLGTALKALGERGSGTKRLEQAMTAYEKALKEYIQARVPLDWAKTQNNLADLEIAFFDKTKDSKHLDQATQYITAALEVFVAAQATHYVEEADKIIAAIQSRKS